MITGLVNLALTINGERREVTAHPDSTLLGVLHDLKLNGTQYGCGRGECGACTVHLDGTAALSCQHVLSEIGTRAVTTIEGLNAEHAFALYDAWAAQGLRLCNRCQSGQIMRAAALLAHTARPSPAQIAQHMQPHDCNCGAPAAMVDVVERAAHALTSGALPVSENA